MWGVRCKLKNELKLRWHNGVDIIFWLNENLGCTIASYPFILSSVKMLEY